MKKLLLSILSLAAIVGIARAEVTLNVDDATDFKGTLVEETKNDDGSVKAGKHYQPIDSLTLGDYTLTFTTTSEKESQIPAYYWAPSTAKNQQRTIRLYAGSTMKIDAPEGTTVTRIDFKGSNAGSSLAVTATPGKFALDGNSGSWTGSASSIEISTSATWRISELTIYTGDDNTAVKGYKYTLATKVESGKKYAIFACDSAATALAEGKSYGYLPAVAVKEEDGTFAAVAEAGFTFEAVESLAEGMYTIKDCLGRYLYQTGTYNSFNLTEDATTEGTVWSVSVAADGAAVIVNSSVSKTIMYGQGYGSFGSYPEQTDTRVLPVLYLQGEETELETPDDPETPDTPTTSTFVPATEIVSGKQYVFVIDDKYCTAIKETYTYGYLYLTSDVTVADGKATVAPADEITVTEVEGKGYTLVDSYGRILGMDDNHFTSFQLYTELNDGCYWSAEFVDGKVKLTNTLNPTCFVCQSTGKEGTFYNNIAPANAPETFNLPTLYVKEATGGIGAVEFEPTGEAVYYNLQGIRVDSDMLTPGVYVRRQGGKAVKVLIR